MSNLSEQIVSAAATFFGMPAESTGTEVHQRLQDSAPLAEVVAQATQASAAEVVTLTARVDELTAELEAATQANATALAERDQRIATLESELQTANAATESVAQRNVEATARIATLSGEIATLKAGRQLEQVADPLHAGAGAGRGAADKVIAVSEGSLKNMLVKKSAV